MRSMAVRVCVAVASLTLVLLLPSVASAQELTLDETLEWLEEELPSQVVMTAESRPSIHWHALERVADCRVRSTYTHDVLPNRPSFLVIASVFDLGQMLDPTLSEDVNPETGDRNLSILLSGKESQSVHQTSTALDESPREELVDRVRVTMLDIGSSDAEAILNAVQHAVQLCGGGG